MIVPLLFSSITSEMAEYQWGVRHERKNFQRLVKVFPIWRKEPYTFSLIGSKTYQEIVGKSISNPLVADQKEEVSLDQHIALASRLFA